MTSFFVKNSGRITFTVVVLTILFWQPGYMSKDSISQLHQAISWDISNAHPALMAAIWGIFNFFVYGPLPMLILQLGLYGYALHKIATFSLPQEKHLKTLAVAFGLLWFFPPVFYIFGTIWKDILMQALGFVLISEIITKQAYFEKPDVVHTSFDKGYIAVVLFSAVLVTSMRHNAAALIVPFLYLFSCNITQNIRFFKSSRIQVKLGLNALVTTLITGFVVLSASGISQLIVTDHKNFSQVIKLFDIVGTSYYSGKNLVDPEIRHLATTKITHETIESFYSPRYHKSSIDHNCRKNCTHTLFPYIADPADQKRVHDNYVGVILSEPVSWLRHKLSVFSHVLNINSPPWTPIFTTMIAENSEGLKFFPSPFHTFITKTVSPYIVNGILYRVWIYYPLGLIFLFIFIFKKPDQWKIGVAVILSGWFYQFTYFVAAPSPDFRYSLWFISMTVLAGFLLIKNRIQKDSEP